MAKGKTAKKASKRAGGALKRAAKTTEPEQKPVTPEVRCSFQKLVDPRHLLQHPRNPNRHSAEQIALLAKIIEHQGWRNPVVVSKRSGYVIAGHGRLEAALKLGAAQVPVDYQDFKDDSDEYAHMLADNKIAELAEMDFQEVSSLLREIKLDLSLTGFRDFETEPLLAANWTPPPVDGSNSSSYKADRHNIVVTQKQRDVITRAIKKKKEELKDPDVADGHALEQICADFLADGKKRK